MQQPNLKLREIIWEITGKCNNGCSYCGSKDLWKEEVNDEIIKKIAYAISEYPPEDIDISGGDPLLVSYETHRFITTLLKNVGTKVKILVNPKSLQKSTSSKVDILRLYDWIGLSVNTEDELYIAKDFINDSPKLGITIITNFNVGNLYMFDSIKKICQDYSFAWQIQLTMTSDDSKAIYKNPLSLEYLFSKIQEAIDNNVNVIPADNLNSGKCSAGSASIGILHDGEVIPCLSMRSWVQNVSELSEGNILNEPLRRIWVHGFIHQRFSEFKSCKDECGNKCFITKDKKIDLSEIFKDINGTGGNTGLQHMLYGVRPFYDRVMAYAVSPGYPNNITMLYGINDSYTLTLSDE